MNAILSLCHFCELHGPAVVFNTQAFRDPLSFNSIQGDATDLNQEFEESEYAWKYGRISKSQTFKSKTSFNTDTCSACRSFPHNQAGIISNDDENRVTFVSSQYPLKEEIFTLLRQAGMRSLSCEAYSERDGAIYFGDAARRHVISYPFLLKDLQARGFSRKYSILVMMADKMFLLNSWCFFIKHIQEIIKLLQDSAAKVYSTEEKQNSHQKGLKPPINSDNTKRHRVAGNPRPLTELVGDKDVWTLLHSRFTWILKVGGLRLQEKLVEGPPLFVPPVNQNGIGLQKLMEILTPENFKKLLHHIYVGNKVAFESSDEKLLADIPLVLKPIVPLYLYRPFHLPATNEGAKDVDSANIVTVLSPASSESLWPNFTLNILPRSSDNGETQGGSLNYDVYASESFPLNARPPQIVRKIFALIENGKFSNSVLNLYFATLIDEWANKVKIWSYVSQNKELMSSHTPSPNQLSPGSASSPSHEKKVLLSLSRSPSPTSSSCGFSHPLTGTNMLLTVVGALECDIPMLKALSNSYEKFGGGFPSEVIS